MEGVTILTEHLCRPINGGTAIFVGLFAIVLLIGAIFFSREIYRKTTKTWKHKLVFGLGIALIVLIGIAGLTSIYFNYADTHIEYVVTIDDSVGFNEFFDKYEIVSQDGQLYTVKEIEWNR